MNTHTRPSRKGGNPCPCSAINRITALLCAALFLAAAPASAQQPTTHPQSLSATESQGQSLALPLAVSNAGDDESDWSIETGSRGAPGVRGDLQQFDDLDSFQAATGVLAFEDFENGPIGPGQGNSCPGAFNSETDNGCFTPGDLIEGFSATAEAGGGTPPGDMDVLGQGVFDVPSAAIGASDLSITRTLVTLAPAVDAVAVELYRRLEGSSAIVTLFDEADNQLGTGSVTILGPGQAGFIGFISPTPIARIQTEFNGQNIDALIGKLYFGEAATLEPGVLSVQPAALDYGPVEVGQSEALTVTVANTAEPGSEALTLDALGLDGGESAEPTNELVTILPDGSQIPNQDAVHNIPGISADGRFVVFASRPSGNQPIFLYRRDRATQTTEPVSVDPDGTPVGVSGTGPAGAISADGRYVVFSGDVTGGGTWGLFRRDIDAGVTERLTLPTTDGENPDGTLGFSVPISAAARFIAFNSPATNLLPGGSPGHDVYVYDTDTDTLERVSVASDGSAGDANSFSPALSADGRYVAFASVASNLVPDDTNGFMDVFVHDRNTGATERVSVASDGTEGNDISASGSTAGIPSISVEGRFVAFVSDASNLVPDVKSARNVFVHDRETGMTERVSVASDGAPAEGGGAGVANISADGRFVTFRSSVALVPDDINNGSDIYIHDRESGTTELVSVAHDGSPLIGAVFQNAIAADAEGRFVVFGTPDPNAVPGGTNGAEQHRIVRDRGFLAITAFAITGGDCAVGTVLEPSDTCTVEITFSPDSTGFFEDVLNVETTDAQSQAVPLQGSGGELEDQIFHHRFEDGGAP